ncbi:MAG: hypothetical protein OEO21_03890 [Candidatus Krumholzibacteria bacterium]|nr:hypothetical protein [Candidatus Krumholzibacteria bacterium]
MKRKKPPALTSPWKIGFFVSLLLLAMSIGVGFLITRSFGLSWSWIELAGGSWDSLSFDLNAFVREMVPLVALVPLFSLVSYFLVTNAVRRYKAYVDSGADYMNLVQSMRDIEDLDDDNTIKKLSNHPQLRDLLLNTRNSVVERESALEEKERELEKRAAKATTSEQLASEASVLASAVVTAREGGFGDSLAVSLPELKQIEQAIRDHLLDAAPGGAAESPGGDRLVQARAKLTEVSSNMSEAIDAMAGEADQVQSAARGLESRLRQQPRKKGAPAGDMGAVAAELEALGDEAKGLAISAAMGASDVGGSELVAFAEELRGIALRATQAASKVTAAASAGGAGGDDMAGQATLWVERSVLLAQSVQALRGQFKTVIDTLRVKLGGHAVDGSPHVAEEIGAAGASGAGAKGEQGTVAAGTPAKASDYEGFERSAPGKVLDEEQPAQRPDIPGLIKDKSLFEEMGGGEDEYFADIPAETESASIEIESDTASDELFAEMGEEDESAASPAEAEEGFIQDPAVAAAKIARAQKPSAPADDPDGDVIDLYALGAVDYELENAQHV